MQLKFTRNSSKGMLGGRNFTLSARLMLTPDEEKTFADYGFLKAKISPLITDNREDWRWKEFDLFSIDGLLKGVPFQSPNSIHLIAVENALIFACRTALDQANAAKSFDGTDHVVDVTPEAVTLVAQG